MVKTLQQLTKEFKERGLFEEAREKQRQILQAGLRETKGQGKFSPRQLQLRAEAQRRLSKLQPTKGERKRIQDKQFVLIESARRTARRNIRLQLQAKLRVARTQKARRKALSQFRSSQLIADLQRQNALERIGKIRVVSPKETERRRIGLRKGTKVIKKSDVRLLTEEREALRKALKKPPTTITETIESKEDKPLPPTTLEKAKVLFQFAREATTDPAVRRVREGLKKISKNVFNKLEKKGLSKEKIADIIINTKLQDRLVDQSKLSEKQKQAFKNLTKLEKNLLVGGLKEIEENPEQIILLAAAGGILPKTLAKIGASKFVIKALKKIPKSVQKKGATIITRSLQTTYLTSSGLRVAAEPTLEKKQERAGRILFGEFAPFSIGTKIGVKGLMKQELKKELDTALKGMSKQRQEAFKDYMKQAEVFGKYEPEARNIKLNNIERIKSPKAQITIRKFLKDSKGNVVVGGSVAQTGQIKVGRKLGDMDLYLEKGGINQAAKQLADKLKKAGVPRVSSSKGQVTIEGKKAIEFHNIERIKQNIQQVTPTWSNWKKYIIETPEGIRIQRIGLQARRKIVASFADAKRLRSGKYKKDLKDFKDISNIIFRNAVKKSRNAFFFKKQKVREVGKLFKKKIPKVKPTKRFIKAKLLKKKVTLTRQKVRVTGEGIKKKISKIIAGVSKVKGEKFNFKGKKFNSKFKRDTINKREIKKKGDFHHIDKKGKGVFLPRGYHKILHAIEGGLIPNGKNTRFFKTLKTGKINKIRQRKLKTVVKDLKKDFEKLNRIFIKRINKGKIKDVSKKDAVKIIRVHKNRKFTRNIIKKKISKKEIKKVRAKALKFIKEKNIDIIDTEGKKLGFGVFGDAVHTGGKKPKAVEILLWKKLKKLPKLRKEVLTHEAIHLLNPKWSEKTVRKFAASEKALQKALKTSLKIRAKTKKIINKRLKKFTKIKKTKLKKSQKPVKKRKIIRPSQPPRKRKPIRPSQPPRPSKRPTPSQPPRRPPKRPPTPPPPRPPRFPPSQPPSQPPKKPPKPPTKPPIFPPTPTKKTVKKISKKGRVIVAGISKIRRTKLKKAIPVFDVFGKSRGKFIKLNKIPLRKTDALSRGAFAVDQTTARTFKIKPVGKSKITGNLLKSERGYFGRTSRKLRRVRIKKGKKFKLTNKYIEKTRHAIDTRGEKKGLALRRFVTRRARPKVKRKITPAQRKVLLKNLKKARRSKKGR